MDAGTKIRIVNAPNFFKDQIGKEATLGSNGKLVPSVVDPKRQMVTLFCGGIYLDPTDYVAI